MRQRKRRSKKEGFTLIELLVATAISSITMAGIMTAFITFLSAADGASAFVQADNKSGNLSGRLIRGSALTPGIRSYNVNDVTVEKDKGGWVLSDGHGHGYRFNRPDKTFEDLAGEVLERDVFNADVEVGGSLISLTLDIRQKGARGRSVKKISTTTIQMRNRG